jgi:hypothetical protein
MGDCACRVAGDWPGSKVSIARDRGSGVAFTCCMAGATKSGFMVLAGPSGPRFPNIGVSV